MLSRCVCALCFGVCVCSLLFGVCLVIWLKCELLCVCSYLEVWVYGGFYFVGVCNLLPMTKLLVFCFVLWVGCVDWMCVWRVFGGFLGCVFLCVLNVRCVVRRLLGR